MSGLYVGVDVGTGSARAGVFDARGALRGVARHPTRTWRGPGNLAEQSSDDIWAACCAAVRAALAQAGAQGRHVAGLGFDATCSMVVLDRDGRPLAVGPGGDAARNVILWMDHRAAAETAEINATGHGVLRSSGGGLSPEMQAPKLLWLKRHRPDTFARAGHFLDLADFLGWRATGDPTRSACAAACKWTYLAHERRWDMSFFEAIGLADLAHDGFRRIGATFVAPGTPLGAGLSAAAAADLGLGPGTVVGASLIDAHAGALATLGALDEDGTVRDPCSRLAHVMGTSACVMALSPEPLHGRGLWGPHRDVLLPGLWLTEGGQSAAGAAIDHLVLCHPAATEARREAAAAGQDLLAWLEHRILVRHGGPSRAVFAARDLHVLPDLMGNRTPEGDPSLRGAVLGLGLDADIESLERLYLAVLCGLGSATADVVDALGASGCRADTLVASGGAARSPLVRQVIADATGLAVAVPETPEPVLLGSAMLGATAAGAHAELATAMPAMSRLAGRVRPAGGEVARFHRGKRTIHAAMRRLEREARATMTES